MQFLNHIRTLITKPSRNIVVLGAPGVGKGTYASRLASSLDIPEISSGRLLRNEVKLATPLSVSIQKILESSKPIDDVTMGKIIQARLSQDDCVKKGMCVFSHAAFPVRCPSSRNN